MYIFAAFRECLFPICRRRARGTIDISNRRREGYVALVWDFVLWSESIPEHRTQAPRPATLGLYANNSGYFRSFMVCVVAKKGVVCIAKRRANGEGNIRKRKDGRWEGRYTAGHNPTTGKAIYKNVLGKTQAEVKEKLKKTIEETKGLDIAKAESYTAVDGCVV